MKAIVLQYPKEQLASQIFSKHKKQC